MVLGKLDARSALMAAVVLGVIPRVAVPQQKGSPTVAVRRIVGLSYPRLANLASVQGKVELIAKVSSAGVVETVQVLSGHILLVDSAKRALLGWQFGCPDPSKPCELKVVFDFMLLDEACDESCPSELQVDLPDRVRVQAKRLPAIID